MCKKPSESELVPVSVFAAQAHVHPITVRRWIAAGQIPAVKLGPRSIRIPSWVLADRLVEAAVDGKSA